MNIRVATVDDAEALVALSRTTFTETFGAGYPPEDLQYFLDLAYELDKHRALLADQNVGVWLLEDGDAVVGYVLAGPCSLPHDEVGENDGEIKRLYILQSHQGRGFGPKLFETAMDWLLASGPRVLWLGVWEENYGAQRLYQRYGFTKAGEYLFEVGETRDREHIYRRPLELNS